MGRTASEDNHKRQRPYIRPNPHLSPQRPRDVRAPKHAYKRYVIDCQARIESDTSSIEIAYDQRLGQGSYAKVYRGISDVGSSLAIKAMDITRTNFLRYFQLEAEVLSRLDHPSVPKLEDCFVTDREAFIAMEFVDGTDLESYCRPLPSEAKARFLFAQLVDCVSYVHNNLIAHRDIKLENILITKSETVKLIDFGLCLKVPFPGYLSSQYVGSPFYMGPESLNQIEHDPFIADTWALGVVLYFMQTGVLPFHSTNLEDLINEVNAQCIDWDPRLFSRKLMSLLKSILEVDPQKRILLEDIKQDPWISRMELEPDTYSPILPSM